MVPDLDMSAKLGMEVCPTVSGNSNCVKLPEEKMMICASNCEDNSFHYDVIEIPKDKGTMTSANGEDNSFHMEVSPSGRDSIMASKGNDEDITCANNREGDPFHMEVSPSGRDSVMASKGNNEDVEVDIVVNVNNGEERVAEMDPQDVTESSSSFGCTDSESGGNGALSDGEVESQVRGDSTSLLGFDGLPDLLKIRKKKLTSHWKKFIRPLMWRCKWVELHLREIQSQESKYERELAEFERRKQCQLQKSATEELGIKSAPFVCQNRSVKLMRRKKRKRVEQTVDLASYTTCHSLFSYFANKRPVPDFAYADFDRGNNEPTLAGHDEFGANVEWTFFKDSDAFESILREIERAQLHVRQLRARMDKVVRDHAGKSSSVSFSFLPSDEPLASCEPNSVPPCWNGDKKPFASVQTTSLHLSEKMLVMPDSAVSGYGDVAPISRMVSSTHQPQDGGECGKMENEVLLCKQVKEELNNNEEAGIQCTEPQMATRGKARTAQNTPGPSSASKMRVTREQPNAQTKYISKLSSPKNKRKRGRRKAAKWSRKLSG